MTKNKDDYEQQGQLYKEQATRLAIKRGMSLVRRENQVIGIFPDGHELVVIDAQDPRYVWKEAMESLQKDVEEQSSTYDQLQIYTDGGSRGNPGPSASGYVIMTAEDEVIEEGGEYLGITTNNQAEYNAVKLALEVAAKYKAKELNFFIDSLLVVNQLNGKYKVKNGDLRPIYEEIKNQIRNFQKVSFTHVYREYNTLADAQVNIILDSREGK